MALHNWAFYCSSDLIFYYHPLLSSNYRPSGFKHAKETPTSEPLHWLLLLCFLPNTYMVHLLHSSQYSLLFYQRWPLWPSSILILPTHSLSPLLVFLLNLPYLTDYVFAYCLPLLTWKETLQALTHRILNKVVEFELKPSPNSEEKLLLSPS